MEQETIEYFKQLAGEIDIPDQKLINLYLRDCAEKELEPSLSWQEQANIDTYLKTIILFDWIKLLLTDNW